MTGTIIRVEPADFPDDENVPMAHAMVEFLFDFAFGSYPNIQTNTPKAVIEAIDKNLREVTSHFGWGKRSSSAFSFSGDGPAKIEAPHYAINDGSAIIVPHFGMTLKAHKKHDDNDHKLYYCALVPRFQMGSMLTCKDEEFIIEAEYVPESYLQNVCNDLEVAKMQKEIARLQKRINLIKGLNQNIEMEDTRFMLSRIVGYRHTAVASSFSLEMPDLEVTNIHRDGFGFIHVEMESSWETWHTMRARLIERYEIKGLALSEFA